MRKFCLTCLSFMVLALLVMPALASEPAISVFVDGMSCSLCAVGLRKNLEAIPEVKKVEVVLKDKTARVITREGKILDPRQVWQGVIHAGFTPKELDLEAVGHIVKHEQTEPLLLKVSNPDQYFVLLDPDAKLKPFLKQKDVKIFLKGKLRPEQKDGLPAIAVLSVTYSH